VNVRLAAVDLDGTLLRTDQTVSERTRRAIAAATAAGVEVVAVTARSPRSTGPLAAAAGIGGAAICANGAIVVDLSSGSILQHEPLSADVAARVARRLRERQPGIAFGWALELRLGSEPAYEAYRGPLAPPRPDDAFPPCDFLEWRDDR
jgi:hydroxymethylpyrimidine pyrophosphatase-like HAD family hydrolase